MCNLFCTIFLTIFYVYFYVQASFALVAELSSWNNDHIAHKAENIHNLALCRKSLLVPEIVTSKPQMATKMCTDGQINTHTHCILGVCPVKIFSFQTL